MFGKKCKYCKCDELHACIKPDGEPCCWVITHPEMICSACYDKCTYQEKLDFKALMTEGTWFEHVSDKMQQKIKEEVENGNKK